MTYVTGSIALCELLIFEEPSFRRRFDHVRVCQIYKRRSGVARSVIDGRANHGHRNEFTRGVLTALASLVVVGILALLVAFGVSVLF